MKKIVTLFALAAVMLAGCSPTVAERCAEAKDPKECVTYANAGGDVSDYLLYGMVGYMIGRNSGGQAYLYRDPSYRGHYPSLRAPIGDRAHQVRKLERKIAAQKVELRRQQAANARKSAELRSMRSTSFSRPSYSRPSFSSRSSFGGGGFRRR